MDKAVLLNIMNITPNINRKLNITFINEENFLLNKGNYLNLEQEKILLQMKKIKEEIYIKKLKLFKIKLLMLIIK